MLNEHRLLAGHFSELNHLLSVLLNWELNKHEHKNQRYTSFSLINVVSTLQDIIIKHIGMILLGRLQHGTIISIMQRSCIEFCCENDWKCSLAKQVLRILLSTF